jgi:hypothetical protein
MITAAVYARKSIDQNILAAPDFISTRARFSTDRRPSEHRRGSSPFPDA